MLPVGQRITDKVKFTDVRQLCHVINRFFKVLNVDEIQGAINLHETLTAPDSFDERDVVNGKVEVLELLALIDAFNSLDDVILQIKNLQAATILVDVGHRLQIKLMKRHLFQSCQHAFIMFRLLADEVWCYKGHLL